VIQITLYNAIILYSVVLGALAAGIWLYTEVTTRRSYRFLERQFLWRCGFCGYTYLDESSDDISQCPRCQSYNAPEDKHVRDPLLVSPRRRETIQIESEGPQRNPSRQKRPHRRRRGPRRRR